MFNNKIWSSFGYLSVNELIQNLWNYFDFKSDQEFKFCNESKLDELIHFNIWWLCVEWPTFFPDLMTVCQEISSGNETFMPGTPDNEKIYFFCVF